MEYVLIGFLVLSLFSLGRCIRYSIVGLVPLSGSQSQRGRAQWRGMTLAVEETLYTLNDVMDVRATFTYNDTECDAEKERAILLEYKQYCEVPSCMIVAVGGACDTSPLATGHDDRSPGSTPQVVFEPKEEGHILTHFPVSFRGGGAGQVYVTLAQTIASRGWNQVVLIADGVSSSGTECRDSLQFELKEANITVATVIQEGGFSDILKSTRLRVVLLCGSDHARTAAIVCGASSGASGTSGSLRYIWLIPTTNASFLAQSLTTACAISGRSLQHVFLFEPQRIEINRKVSQVFSHVVNTDLSLATDPNLQIEAGLAYDATRVLLDSLRAIRPAVFSEFLNGKDIADRIWREIKSRRWTGVTGVIEIDDGGRRKLITQVYGFLGDRLSLVGMDGVTEGSHPSAIAGATDGHIGMDSSMNGIPLSLFVVMCILAAIGMAYALALVVFNVTKRTDRTIKMTSPNINVVSLLACCGGYAVMVMVGLDTTRGISVNTMQRLLQAAAYVLVIGFSLLYGAVFAKSWRVFTIFKNLNANGKVTRDEHLLIGVFFMIVLDLIVLLSWHLMDPIVCSRHQLHQMYDHDNLTDVVVEVDTCNSRMQHVWIPVIYTYKFLILLLGFLFAWQTRRVTLPALRDTDMIHISIASLVVLSLVALPLLVVTPAGSGTMVYATGALVIWMVITVDISVLFLPKVLLYRRESRRKTRGESFRFQFSESMKRTQDALRRMMACLCCGSAENDKYAHEMLVTEIETLKRTVKDKDNTIRDLTDRLYMGADKFQQYLRHPSRSQDNLSDMQQRPTPCSPAQYHPQRQQQLQQLGKTRSLDVQELYDMAQNQRRITSQDHENLRRARTYIERRPPGSDAHPRRIHDSPVRLGDGNIYSIQRDHHPVERTDLDVHTPVRRRQESGNPYQIRSIPRTPSPNVDSAFDNTSPSSDNSRVSLQDVRWQNGQSSTDINRPRDVQNERIDLEAMEKEVAPSMNGVHSPKSINHRPAVGYAQAQTHADSYVGSRSHDHYRAHPNPHSNKSSRIY